MLLTMRTAEADTAAGTTSTGKAQPGICACATAMRALCAGHPGGLGLQLRESLTWRP